jgi:hypothetical protein
MNQWFTSYPVLAPRYGSCRKATKSMTFQAAVDLPIAGLVTLRHKALHIFLRKAPSVVERCLMYRAWGTNIAIVLGFRTMTVR